MKLEIKCLECSKRTKRFEIGPAAFASDGVREILLKDNLICPKCKRDISEGKCITHGGIFMISLMAITMSRIGEKEGSSHVPEHLRGMAIVTKENYDRLKVQSKASIKLVEKLDNHSKCEIK